MSEGDSIVYQDELTGFQSAAQTELQPEPPVIDVDALNERYAAEGEQYAAQTVDDKGEDAPRPQPRRVRLVYADGSGFRGPGKAGE